METKKLSAVGALVLEMARQLVDWPSQARVQELAGEQFTLLELSVGRSDTGKILGREGRTAGNLRTLLACISGRARRKFTLVMPMSALPVRLHRNYTEDPESNQRQSDVSRANY